MTFTRIKTILKIIMLRKVIKRRFLLRETYLKPSIIELEKLEYEKLANATRKKVSNIFWDQQSKVENAFIGKIKREF